ncbi:MAG: PAS domain-containing protein [Pseudomonadota bacterium]
MKVTDAVLKDLLAYWEQLRAGREVPYRSEIDPRRFESALEHMFILEHLGEGNIRIRLAGMYLCEMMGMELRGMSLRALMRLEDRAPLDSALAQVLSGPAVAHLDLDAHTPSGRRRPASMLLLPLRSDFGDISRVLGCLRIDGSSVQDGSPLRFSIGAAQIRPISVDNAAPQRAAMPGFAESGAEFVHDGPQLRSIEGGAQRRTERRRNHLRIIDND